jgi:predicted DCC family thiol-disulfide oxidoreductase YuxK
MVTSKPVDDLVNEHSLSSNQKIPTPLFVYDGGCPFCRYFAELSELHSGIQGLKICDGRSDHQLRRKLSGLGCDLRNGAVLMVGDELFHGAAAIQWLSARMQPSSELLAVLGTLMKSQKQSRIIYPFLLAARRLALAIKGLPLDPD